MAVFKLETSLIDPQQSFVALIVRDAIFSSCRTLSKELLWWIRMSRANNRMFETESSQDKGSYSVNP